MQTVGLRVYLAAHAPADPQFWFKPLCDEEKPKDIGKIIEWSNKYEKDRLLQWPLAWADAQIKLLGDDVEITYFKKG